MKERLTDMERQELDNRASEVLRKHNIDPSDGYDIVALATDMGFFVGTTALDDNEDGFIMVDSNDDANLLDTGSSKIIAINKSRDAYFMRFVIAHELGHYVINGAKQKIFAHRKKTDCPRVENEQQIDYFAASLLMPKEAFIAKNQQLREEGMDYPKRTAELSRIFRAPIESVIRRFKELELIKVEEPK